jgi:hypothetical protein
LIARKITELFGFNCGVRPFYVYAAPFLSGGVLCLLSASFGKQFHNVTTQFVMPKSMTLASAGAIQGK